MTYFKIFINIIAGICLLALFLIILYCCGFILTHPINEDGCSTRVFVPFLVATLPFYIWPCRHISKQLLKIQQSLAKHFFLLFKSVLLVLSFFGLLMIYFYGILLHFFPEQICL